jgi:hypothetical protein
MSHRQFEDIQSIQDERIAQATVSDEHQKLHNQF